MKAVLHTGTEVAWSEAFGEEPWSRLPVGKVVFIEAPTGEKHGRG